MKIGHKMKCFLNKKIVCLPRVASDPFFSLHIAANSKKSIFMMEKGLPTIMAHMVDLSKRTIPLSPVEA